MPRIIWEQQMDARVRNRAARKDILHELRQIVAEEITRFDPSFQLDWEKHTVTDIDIRHEDAEGDKPVIITIRGLHKPDRVTNSQKIGDAIRERANPLFAREGLEWSLSLCWDEYYYNDGEE